MTDAPTRITLTMAVDRLGEFFSLLQQGFLVPARVGYPLEELLDREWGVSPAYAAERITTVFLNARAIDDLKGTVVRDGDRLALSGAMPGLVGATMRRGGYYAAMRGAMTHREGEYNGTEGVGTIRVKLFNLLLTELGPEFLRRGIGLSAAEAAVFFGERGEWFWEGCAGISLDGESVPLDAPPGGFLPENKDVRLIVEFRGER